MAQSETGSSFLANMNKPEPLTISGNLENNWTKFKKQLDVFIKASGASKLDKTQQANILLNFLGTDGNELLESIVLTADELNSYDAIIAKLDGLCKSKVNIIYERHCFYARNQKEGEPFHDFLIDVKKLAKSCGFGGSMNELIRDRIIFGIHNKSLQLKLIKEGNPTMEQTIEMCIIDEKMYQQSKEIQHGKEKDVDFVKKKSFYYKERENKDRNSCNFCGTIHQRGKCPAFGKRCSNCKKRNHFAGVCKSKHVRELREENSEENENEKDEYFVDELNVSLKNNWLEKLRVNRCCDVDFKLDSGAEVNIIPKAIFDKLKKYCKQLSFEKSSCIIRGYGGFQIPTLGQLKLDIQNKKSSVQERFIVVNMENSVFQFWVCRHVSSWGYLRE